MGVGHSMTSKIDLENTCPSLKRCPFCGNYASYYYNHTPKFGGKYFVFVLCKVCHAQSRCFTISGNGDDVKEFEDIGDMSESSRIAFQKAEDAWNERAYSDLKFDTIE